MTLMVFIQNMHVLNCRNEYKSVFKTPITTNKFVIVGIVSAIVLQIIVMENSFLSKALQTTTLKISNIISLFLIATLTIVVMEIYKKLRYKES